MPIRDSDLARLSAVVSVTLSGTQVPKIDTPKVGNSDPEQVETVPFEMKVAKLKSKIASLF